MRTLAEIKTDLVWAHYCKDWEAAARLSQEKEMVKSKMRRLCIDCGVPLAKRKPESMRCAIHARIKMYYEKTLGPIYT